MPLDQPVSGGRASRVVRSSCQCTHWGSERALWSPLAIPSHPPHLLLRPGARLFAHELLGRAIEGARRTASGIQGACGRSDNNTGVLAVHDLGIASDQASRGRL